MGRLTGKTAVVTGAGRGIGRGVARMFRAAGAEVLGCDINPDTLATLADEEAGIEKKHWWRRRKAQPQPSVLPAQPAEQPAPTLQVQTPPAEQYASVPRDPYPEREPRYEVVTQRQAPEPQDDFFSDPAPSPAASDDDLLTASTSSAFDDDELFTATTSRSLAEDAAFTAPPAESASGAEADTDDDMLNATTNAAPSERDEELIASE